MSGPGEGWAVRRDGDVRWVECAALAAIPGLIHGFSMDPDAAGGSFDQGGWPFADPECARNRRRFAAAIGAQGVEARHLRQVHGARCLDAGAFAGAVADAPEADGWFAARAPGRLLAVRTADCVPLLLADRDGRRAAAVHSGWRGTAARIAAGAVGRLTALGQDPARLVAALGPAIGGARYEVGEEVLRAVAASLGLEPGDVAVARPGGGKPGIDLRRCIGRQLVGAGIPPDAVHIAPWCTFDGEGRFASFRRQGAAAGRMAAAIGWPAP